MQFSYRFISRRTWFAFAALVVCATAALPTEGAEKSAPDMSTPKKAAVAFGKAMDTGDMEMVHLTAIGTDAQFATVNGLSNMFTAMRRYSAAAEKKFGDKGKLPAGAMPDLAAEFEKNDEKIDGDKATLVDKGRPNDKHPMALKKEGGIWKVDLNSMPPEVAEMGKSARKAADAIDAISKDVEAGKYKTAEEAMAAMQAAMAAAMQGSGAP